MFKNLCWATVKAVLGHRSAIGSNRASVHSGAGWLLHSDAWSIRGCGGQNSANSMGRTICAVCSSESPEKGSI